jgi:hypothetical protein
MWNHRPSTMGTVASLTVQVEDHSPSVEAVEPRSAQSPGCLGCRSTMPGLPSERQEHRCHVRAVVGPLLHAQQRHLHAAQHLGGPVHAAGAYGCS